MWFFFSSFPRVKSHNRLTSRHKNVETGVPWALFWHVAINVPIKLLRYFNAITLVLLMFGSAGLIPSSGYRLCGVLRLLLTSQKHAGRWIGYAKWPLHARCSRDSPWIHHNRDRAMLSKDEWMSFCLAGNVVRSLSWSDVLLQRMCLHHKRYPSAITFRPNFLRTLQTLCQMF